MENSDQDRAKRKLNRTISFIEDGESKDPVQDKYHTATPSLLGRWRSVKRNTSVEEKEKDDSSEVSSRVDDLIFLESYEDQGSEEEISITVCKEMIRQHLVELMKTKAGNVQLLLDLETEGRITPDNVDLAFKDATLFERNVAFLMAVFLKRKDLTAFFLGARIDLDFYEPRLGFGALHLSGFSGCIDCTGYLIANGADVNRLLSSYTPLHCAAFGNSPVTAKMLLRAGAKTSIVGAGSESLGCNETVLHSAVRANAIECVQLFIDEEVDANSVGGNGLTPLHLAADYGYTECLRLLLRSKKCRLNMETGERRMTALHLAAEGGSSDCVKLLLDHGASPNARNLRQQTPLHLAAKCCYECVDLLLHGGADPNAQDGDNRTPLHAAVCKSSFASSMDVTKRLTRAKANINMADKFGYTALHIAALNELSECVDCLILAGADLSALTRGGSSALSIVARRSHCSLPAITQVLDDCITVTDRQVSSKEVILKFNFRYLLQNCRFGEVNLLETFVKDGQKDLLKHPLCEALLYLKWEKLRKFYVARLLFCFVFVSLLSLYVLTALAYECYNGSLLPEVGLRALTNVSALCSPDSALGALLRDNPAVIRWEWYILAAMSLAETCRKLLGLCGYRSVKQYFAAIHNIIEWFLVASVFAVSFIYDGRTHKWQNHVGAVAVLCGWANLMLMIGNLPAFGSYVLMFTRVQREFAKLFLTFFCLFIGFTVCFCVMFPRDTAFSNPFISLVKIVVMFAGELEFLDLLENVQAEGSLILNITSLVVLLLFVIFVSTILMNLLIAIAVHDIKGLKKTAVLQKLVGQTDLIAHIESVLSNRYLPGFYINLFRMSSLIFPSSYGLVIAVKPLSPRETRLPLRVMRCGLEIARQKKGGAAPGGLSLCSAKRLTVSKDRLDMEELHSVLMRLTWEIEQLKDAVVKSKGKTAHP